MQFPALLDIWSLMYSDGRRISPVLVNFGDFMDLFEVRSEASWSACLPPRRRTSGSCLWPLGVNISMFDASVATNSLDVPAPFNWKIHQGLIHCVYPQSYGNRSKNIITKARIQVKLQCQFCIQRSCTLSHLIVVKSRALTIIAWWLRKYSYS